MLDLVLSSWSSACSFTWPSRFLAGMKESRIYARSCLVALLEDVDDKVSCVAIQDNVDDLAQGFEEKVSTV